MIVRKTLGTKVKKIYRGKTDGVKTRALYRITTYWFLVFPIYSKQELIE